MAGPSILFTGSVIILDTGDSRFSFKAVSGTQKKISKEIYTFDYSSDRQNRSDEGPIPQGAYYVVPDEITALPTWKMKLIWKMPSLLTGISDDTKKAYIDAWGSCRLSIHAAAGNNQAGREGGFFIHGGTSPGSHGCIDIGTQAPLFFEKFTAVTNSLRNDKIPLDVNYRVHQTNTSNIA
jgi:hypothetical protein